MPNYDDYSYNYILIYPPNNWIYFSRGIIPPLLGSSVLRSVQFGVFETVRGALNRQDTLPRSTLLGVDTHVYLAGMAAGAARAAIECPIEVLSNKQQR